jgi:non-lysosomal glucosylceramidase
MNRVYLETEHQELFVADADLRQPVKLHVPSALGTLGYYVCLRVPQSYADAFHGTTTRLVVGGLRPDDVTLVWGEGCKEPQVHPSKLDGHCWLLLCRAFVSRGDGVLTFQKLPAGLKRADVLLCTWTRFVESGQADDWLAGQADPLWASGGVPLGGIGTGKIELCRDGRFRNYSGNNNQDMPFEEPDGLEGAYLAVEVDGDARVLASRAAGDLPPVQKLQADLAFPQVTLKAPSAFPALDVSVLASGPIVPHDVDTSSLPGFVLRWTVKNRSAQPARVTCRLAWPNLVGQGGGIGKPETRIGYADGFYRYWESPADWQAELVSGRGWQGLKYGNSPAPECASADGEQFLAVRGGRGAKVDSDPRRGSVARSITVPARGEASVEMVVVWAMPHWIDTLGSDRGLYWQNLAPDGEGVVSLLFRRLDKIVAEGGALRQLLTAGSLPEWQRERLVNCAYPLVTNSVFYKDGRFSINEGPTEMAGCYGTIDQRLGSHPATQFLFPELNARELRQFAAYQSPNGGVNHDLGHGHLERGPLDQPWPDIPCSFAIQLARHAWSTGDATFAKEMWPRVKKAIARGRLWADAGGGVAQVGGEDNLGTSYDGYHYVGTTPYMGTLWIAALQVAGEWARREGEPEVAAEMEELAAKAFERMEADLWNGSYYRSYASVTGPVNENCHAGMLAGEWYARMLAGRDVLPQTRLRECGKAWMRLNGAKNFAVPPDEVSPEGELRSEYGWLPYVEAFGLAALAATGTKGIEPVWKRILAAMQGDGRHPCDTKLMYQPTTGGQSWGAYYMTAPASWLVYEALLDFCFDASSGTLRVGTDRDGGWPVVHPRFWGLARVRQGKVALKVIRHFGRPAKVSAVQVRKTKQKEKEDTAYETRPLKAAAVLKQGAVLRWTAEGGRSILLRENEY